MSTIKKRISKDFEKQLSCFYIQRPQIQVFTKPKISQIQFLEKV
jgi:hypothetical protein